MWPQPLPCQQLLSLLKGEGEGPGNMDLMGVFLWHCRHHPCLLIPVP
uniref:Uncharacterized protein MANES_01G258800 n=1 Tax=Rhizophora mucronata TaxID=61149 RepID=A0A2P2LZP9_RHIMU